MQSLTISNNQAVPVQDIPVISYNAFYSLNTGFIDESPDWHCVNYFGYREGEEIRLICCMADDASHLIHVSSCRVHPNEELASFSARHLCFEKFEREIHENFGIKFPGHPWLKPLRYSADRFDRSVAVGDYPFYSIESEELHEVGVGPIHAGVIEPGHFRFICDGEQILHLEIQLGYQHRGIEKLFLERRRPVERGTLAENIAGDTVAGHSVAFASVVEALAGYTVDPETDLARTIALELERIAIHTGDLSAVCTDIAYQLGSAVYGRLRTPVINFMQEWCGNRLSKGLIRPGKMQYPLSGTLIERLNQVLDNYEPDFTEMSRQLFALPSALSRFERTGIVTYEDTLLIGAVGMAARMAGLDRDIRASHPTLMYSGLNHSPVIKHHGDVYSRVQIRKEEVFQSMQYLRSLMPLVKEGYDTSAPRLTPQGNLFAISLVEGWRGEICHCAITDASGELLIYKVKDPSFHNWTSLALAVRNNGISDFPICNKSFNLSYCGHDL